MIFSNMKKTAVAYCVCAVMLCTCGGSESTAPPDTVTDTENAAAETADGAGAAGVMRFRGNAGTSVYEDALFRPASLAGEPKIIWQAKVEKGHSGVSLAGNRLYTMGNDRTNDFVYCLDAATGKTMWSFSYPASNSEHPGPRATPTIDGNRLYTFSSDGQIFVLDCEKGTVIWKRRLLTEYNIMFPTWGFAGSALIDGERVIFNAGGAGIAFNKNTGDPVWKSADGIGGYATPVMTSLNGKKVLALFTQTGLSGVDPENGKPLWRTEWRTSFDVNAADPLFFNDGVFITSGYRTGCALYSIGDSGLAEIWRNQNMSSHFPSPVLIDGVIYGFDGDSGRTGAFVGLDANSGGILLKERMRFSNFIVVNGKFVIISERGEIVVANVARDSFTRLAESKLRPEVYWAPAVAANGRLYVRNGSGDLFCIDTR